MCGACAATAMSFPLTVSQASPRTGTSRHASRTSARGNASNSVEPAASASVAFARAISSASPRTASRIRIP